MWYPATIKVPAANEPVSEQEARRQCGLAADDASQDAQLALLIAAARAHIEKYCGIRLPVQTLTIPCDSFADLARLPDAPVRSVEAIRYVDRNGDVQTLANSNYEPRLDGLEPSVVLGHGSTWPALRPGSRIEVEIVVGYDQLPADLKAAILLMVASQFSFARADLLMRREDIEGVGSTQWGGVIEVNQALRKSIDTLLENYRCWSLA